MALILDDLEFGLGATLNQIKKEDINIIIYSDTVETNSNDILSELKNSMNLYHLNYFVQPHGRNMRFTDQQVGIRQSLFRLKKSFTPDIIFSPSPRSYNPDHMVLGESCLSVFQEQTILFYETLRGDYEHRPNFYNKITDEDMKVKQSALARYKTQSKKHYSNPFVIQAQALFRGSQINSHLAEAFEVGRIIHG